SRRHALHAWPLRSHRRCSRNRKKAQSHGCWHLRAVLMDGGKGAKQISPMNKGGTQTVGDIKVTMVNAQHSCGIQEGDQIIYGGEACGYVIHFDNGLKIYHAGDTNVFGDMQIIRELYAPDIAMLPIGDHYTMSPREAAYACKLLKPKTVIPMHFGTFPLLTGRPGDLQKLAPDVEVVELKPGVTVS